MTTDTILKMMLFGVVVVGVLIVTLMVFPIVEECGPTPKCPLEWKDIADQRHECVDRWLDECEERY